MTEIRPVREIEGPTFLSLLCDVFELDYDRASGIFFHEPMFDLNRKWAFFENSKMVSVLTTVPLNFGWGKAIGIAGVATRVDRQGEGLAGKLLDVVLNASEAAGEGPALLFAKDTRMYERAGFSVLDSVIRADLGGTAELGLQGMLAFDEVQNAYESWSHQDSNRLLRNEQRWAYWKWNLRVCTPLGAGYLCHEGSTIREIVASDQPSSWEFAQGTDWVGLQSMAKTLNLPLIAPLHELHLMGRNFPTIPQMFMTDQF